MSLEAFLQQLGQLRPDADLDSVIRDLKPALAPADAEAIRRCALVRWFDRDVFDFLCSGLDERPTIERFVELSDIAAVSPGSWAIESDERARLLAEWRSNMDTWRKWNQELGEYFSQKAGPETRLDALYHLAASVDLDKAADRFREWFAEADQRSDLAQCHALLEMLRIQSEWRGPALSNARNECEQQYKARMLFLDDWYKTGSYFRRGVPYRKFHEVLDQAGSDRWVFHIHATGGTGKTIFQRWLIAHDLVPNRIPCARVDFDDHRGITGTLVDHPMRLFSVMFSQLSQQYQGTTRQSLQLRLARENNSPGWNPNLLAEVRRQLKGADQTGPLVVMLDTLEDVTLSAADWLRNCLNALREIRQECPKLILVLSGRYDISTRTDALRPGEFLSYELPRFTEPEARDYLGTRGIQEGPVRDAIVERSGGDEEAPDTSTAEAANLTGRNPFKLAMFAELVLNRTEITADEVMRLPRVDIAYLIERVIKRIESQPLRWMIRYGAIARVLTPEFAEQVLLPPLLEALRGKGIDAPTEGIEGYEDVWVADPKSADALEKNGITELWSGLSTYARDRGWLSSTMDTTGETVLRFHPEVVQPTRALLRTQEIFPDLQRRAVRFFSDKAKDALLSDQSDAAITIAIADTCEAVFHQFQLEGPAARAYWLGKVREAERFGLSRARRIASEITSRDYARAEITPYPAVSSAATLVRAHCEVAHLLLRESGASFVHGNNWPEFRRWVELALEAAGSDAAASAEISPFLRMLLDICRASSVPIAPESLANVSVSTRNIRERAMLEVLLGRAYALAGSSEAPVHYREALRLAEEGGLTDISAFEIHLSLADYYKTKGTHSTVLEAYRQAVDAASGGRELARALQRRALYAFDVGDTAAVDRELAELAELPPDVHPSPVALHVLRARAALAELDPLAAAGHARHGLELARTGLDTARCIDLTAEALSLQYQFRAALDNWDSASSQYDHAGSPAGSARCALLSIGLRAIVMRDFRGASAMLTSAQNLPGSSGPDIFLELQLFRAYIAHSGGRRDEAETVVQAMLSMKGELGWPDRIRAQVLIFGLCFGMLAGDDDAPEEILRVVDEIQPLTLRCSLLDWVAHAVDPVLVSEEFARRLMELFPRPRPGSDRDTSMLIQCADLYRIVGQRNEAEAALLSARPAGLLATWQLNLARDRLHVETAYGALLSDFDASDMAESPLRDAVWIKAVREARWHGQQERAYQLLQIGPRKIAQEVPNSWQALILRTRARLPGPVPPKSLQDEADALDASLGTTEPERDERVVLVRDEDLPAEYAHPEAVIDMLLGTSTPVVAEMERHLPRDNEVAIEVAGQTAMLPWELARPLLWRQSYRALAGGAPFLGGRPSNEVIVVGAGQDPSSEHGYNVTDGGGFEAIYSRLGIHQHAMNPAEFIYSDWSSREAPALIHIIAAVRDSSGGAYLDFEGTEERTSHLAAQKASPIFEIFPSTLDRTLAMMPRPPFVLLDIARPYNRTETVRSLLLRNLFASHLFEFGHVKGILGGGLAAPGERIELLQFILPSLLIDTVDTPLRRAPPRTGNLERDMAWSMLALWSNNPGDRLFVQ